MELFSDMKGSSASALKWLFAFIALVTFLGLCFKDTVGTWGDTICPFLTGLCNAAPLLIGTVVLLLLWLTYRLLAGDWNPFELIRGTDQRLSTSKCQFFLWTVVALFVYASFYAKRAALGFLDPEGFKVPTNLLLAMGLSVTTAIAAKGITTSQINNGTVSKDWVKPPEAQTSDLVQDDGGAVDLTKVQMLGWTIIALGAYLTAAVHTIRSMTQGSKLPDIDTALMVLMGLGQGAYLAKKMVVNSTPTITGIEPATSRPGREVKLTGTSFGTTQGHSVIAVDGVVPHPPVAIKSWSDTSIVIVLPGPPLPPGWASGPKAVSLTLDSGVDSNSIRLVLLPLGPTITAITAVDTSLRIAGTDFGPAIGSVRLNDRPAGQITAWSDTSITCLNPDPATIRSSTTVGVKVFLPGDQQTPAVEKQGLPVT